MRLGRGVEYRDLLHVSKIANGGLLATLEFTDTGGRVAPVTAMSVSESKLMLRIDSVQASYEGTINADASAISGVWKQPNFVVPLDFSRTTVPRKEHQQTRPSDINGYWMGTVKFDPMPGCDSSMSEERYAFHIINTADGLTATWYMSDNDTLGWKATSVARDNASLDIDMEQLASTFHGTINGEKTVINGAWIHDGRSYPLVLKRSKHSPKPELREPQWCNMNGVPGY